MAITNKTRNQIRKWVSSNDCGDLLEEFLSIRIQRSHLYNKSMAEVCKPVHKNEPAYKKYGNETIEEFKHLMEIYFAEDVPASRFPFTICDSIWKYVMEEIENYYDIGKILIEYKEGIKLEEMNEDF